MSIFMPALAGMQKPQIAKPTWQWERVTPPYVDEGDAVTVRLTGTNLEVGSRIIVWFTDAAAPDGVWVESWFNVMRRVGESRGLSVQRLALNAGVPSGKGYLDVLFTVTSGYVPGTDWVFTNYSRKNRSDNQGLLPDGTRGRDVQIIPRTIPTNEGGVPDHDGRLQGRIPSYTYIRDTSRKPGGYPTIIIRHEDGDGGAAQANIKEGTRFRIRIETQNVVPDTVLRLYVANEAQYDITPSFRSEIVRAANAVGCVGSVVQWTPATSDQWFNGGLIRFTESYSDLNPVVMNFSATADSIDEPDEQIDFLAQVYREGDISDYGGVANPRGNWDSGTIYVQKDWVYYVPTGRKFFYTAGASTKGNSPPTDNDTYDNGYWREYRPVEFTGGSHSKIISDQPPRQWELRATTDGSTISYTIQGPDNSSGSVAFASINPPPGFDGALADALGASGYMSLSGGRLSTTNTIKGAGAISFTVPHPAGQSGKHVLRINDRSGGNSWITIGHACVYYTAPALPAVPVNIYGLNLAGGEFGKIRDASGNYTAYNGGRYYYPSKPENGDPATRHQQMDYHWGKGARIARMPLRWERIQPDPFGPLYYGPDEPFTAANSLDMRRVIEATNYWTALGGVMLLDVHGYGEREYLDPADGSYKSARVRFDSPGNVTPEALVDLWVKLAAVFESNPRVQLDVQNEPKEINYIPGAKNWSDTSQWIINAIRAETGAAQMVHREGTEFSGAASWVKNGNADANVSAYDPVGNHVFHVHSYNDPGVGTDPGGSGTNGRCDPSKGKARLTAITAWARANGFRLFLGETAGGDPAIEGQETCGPLMRDLYRYLLDNRDVWMGWTTWGAGFPPSYFFALDPANKNYADPIDTGSMKMVQPFWIEGNGLT